MQRLDIGRDQLVLAAELLCDQPLHGLRVDPQQRRERADIDDVLEELALARVRVALVAQRRQRHADRRDVVAELRRRQRLGRVVEEIAARVDGRDVLVPGLRVHGDHEVHAAAPAEMPGLRDAHLVPGRQALDVRREDVARRHRHAHAQDRAREQPVGARRARAVHIGEFDDEVVDRGAAAARRRLRLRHHEAPRAQPREPACAVSSRNFCMSQAPVGQRSAQRPQCRQTSSSLTMMRPVFRKGET